MEMICFCHLDLFPTVTPVSVLTGYEVSIYKGKPNNVGKTDEDLKWWP